MKPNVLTLQWVCGIFGAVLTAWSHLQAFDLHSLLSAAGGALVAGSVAVNITGSGQVRVKDLPKDMQDRLSDG